MKIAGRSKDYALPACASKNWSSSILQILTERWAAHSAVCMLEINFYQLGKK